MSKVTIEVPDDASPMIKRAVGAGLVLAHGVARREGEGLMADSPIPITTRAAVRAGGPE